jgi:uncharacterized protein involved in exopolysaccharide biosynthesis
MEAYSIYNVLLRIKYFIILITKNLKLIALFGILGACIGFYLFKVNVKVYEAQSTLMLDKGASSIGALSGALSMASQFGLNGLGDNEAEKMIQVLKSRTVVKSTIFKSIEINDTLDFIANHFINSEWPKEKNILIKLNPRDTSLLIVNDEKKKVIERIYSYFTKQCLFVDVSNEGIIGLTVKLKSEGLALKLNKELVKKMSEYYSANLTEKEVKNLNLINKKLDSIKSRLAIAEVKYLSFKDNNIASVKAQARLEEIRLRRDVELLNKLYIEAVKNHEFAKFELEYEKPLIQIIDSPMKPLNANKIGLVISLILYSFFGVFIALLFVIGRDLWRQVSTKMSEIEQDLSSKLN